MKNKKLVVSLSVALAVTVAAFAAIMIINKPEIEVGAKNIAVTIVYADKTEKEIEINTDAEFLADALFEKELVIQEEYETGFYTEIDGVKADYNVDQSWWCLTKDGEMTSVGMNEQPINDGDQFEITYTAG